VTETDLALELNDVALSRGDRVLIAGLSFRLVPGQLALVTGPNGSGKTTLLRTIAGLAPPHAGTIRLNGTPVSALEPEERAHVTYQAHLEGLKKDLTVEENIFIFSQLRSSIHSASEVISELGLEPHAKRAVRQLSAGQKRRVVLAVLRMSGARLWLLDEPLTNLDVEGRALVARWIEQHIAEQGMAVVATHLAETLKRPGALLVEL
jgi:heme exporter protein A